MLACVLACAATAAAQAAPVATLRGTLSDPIHHHVIAGAQIELHSGTSMWRTHTNQRGAFSFVGVPAGRMEVAISAEGYAPVTVATCAVPEETRSLPLFVVPELHAISNSAAAQRYFNRAYLHDGEVASGPHFMVTTDQYTLGFCPA